MNDVFSAILKFFAGTALTACTVMFLGLIAKCWWLLFMLGWGVL